MDFYATLGRACGHPSAMEELFGAGMTGLRLNLSHAALKDSLPFSLTCVSLCFLFKTDVFRHVGLSLHLQFLAASRGYCCIPDIFYFFSDHSAMRRIASRTSSRLPKDVRRK